MLFFPLFDDEGGAMQLANGTDYGLMATVWSHGGNRALRVSCGIKADQVYINSFAALHDISQTRMTIAKHD